MRRSWSAERVPQPGREAVNDEPRKGSGFVYVDPPHVDGKCDRCLRPFEDGEREVERYDGEVVCIECDGDLGGTA